MWTSQNYSMFPKSWEEVFHPSTGTSHSQFLPIFVIVPMVELAHDGVRGTLVIEENVPGLDMVDNHFEMRYH